MSGDATVRPMHGKPGNQACSVPAGVPGAGRRRCCLHPPQAHSHGKAQPRATCSPRTLFGKQAPTRPAAGAVDRRRH
eukprot:13336762-Alexandrium_andersonii.AAC.1